MNSRISPFIEPLKRHQHDWVSIENEWYVTLLLPATGRNHFPVVRILSWRELFGRLAYWDRELALAAAQRLLSPDVQGSKEQDELLGVLHAAALMHAGRAEPDDLLHARQLLGLPMVLPPSAYTELPEAPNHIGKPHD
jgi:hypothetical protein